MRIFKAGPNVLLAGLAIVLFWFVQVLGAGLNFVGWGVPHSGIQPVQLMGADWMFIVSSAGIILVGLGWSRFHWSLATAGLAGTPQTRWIIFDELAKFSMAVLVSLACMGVMTIAFTHLDDVNPPPGVIRLRHIDSF